jgi:hypothetical protein
VNEDDLEEVIPMPDEDEDEPIETEEAPEEVAAK